MLEPKVPEANPTQPSTQRTAQETMQEVTQEMTHAVTHPFPGLTRRVLTCTPESMLVEHTMEAGSVFPWHSHRHEQTVFVLEGELSVETRESPSGPVTGRDARGGDSWVVPGHLEHRVTACTRARALDFFTPFREDYLPEAAAPVPPASS